MHRVVVTGMGAITPLGNNVETFWNNIKSGVNGIDEIKSIDSDLLKMKIAGELKDFNPEGILDKREMRRFDKVCQYAIVAADQAIKDAGLDLEKMDTSRIGTMIGTGIGGFTTIERDIKAAYESVNKNGKLKVAPLFIPMSIANMAAGNVAIKFGLRGTCIATVTACATGTHSIGEAFRNIRYGYSDIILAGGSEAAITPVSINGFVNLTALSSSEDITRASIPFDKERSGFVMGEGAGVLVLESLESAKKRGAKILGEVVGYGSTCDAYHMTSPSPDGEGAARAMQEAINEAGISIDEVSYINAHGTATPYNDKFETKAIKTVFGDRAYDIPVSSTKSMTGHLLGAAGAIEGIVSIKTTMEDFVPPTIGLKVQDEDCDLDYVPNEGRKTEVNYAMSNSLGFGGHNAVILVKKYKEEM